MVDDKQIAELKKYIDEAENSLEAAKKALEAITGEAFESSKKSTPIGLNVSKDGKVIEGFFDGENMVGPEGKIFPVPANYASKSKLVEGDKLKLTVAEDGSFIFKQIGPVERIKLVGDLFFSDNAFFVRTEGKKFNLLYAAATYYKAKAGDKVTIVVPAEGNPTWAALDNVIHDVATPNPKEETGIFDIDKAGNGSDDPFKIDQALFPANAPTNQVGIAPAANPNEVIVQPNPVATPVAATEPETVQSTFNPTLPVEPTLAEGATAGPAITNQQPALTPTEPTLADSDEEQTLDMQI